MIWSTWCNQGSYCRLILSYVYSFWRNCRCLKIDANKATDRVSRIPLATSRTSQRARINPYRRGYPLPCPVKKLGKWRDASTDKCLSLRSSTITNPSYCCKTSPKSMKNRDCWPITALFPCLSMRGSVTRTQYGPLNKLRGCQRDSSRYYFVYGSWYWYCTFTDFWF